MTKNSPGQIDKFRAAAKDAGADMSEAEFKLSLKKVAQSKTAHASDCALHNAPAMEAGLCDCGATAPR